MNDVMIRENVEDIVRNRNGALTLFGEAYELAERAFEKFQEARAAVHRATPSSRTFEYRAPADGTKTFGEFVKLPRRELFSEEMRRDTDAAVWAHIVGVTNLESLMDRKAKEQLREQLRKEPPEVTCENIRATVEGFMGDADTIFKRGIAECFSNLDRRFRSHDGWKIGDRIVIDNCFDSNGSWNYHRSTRDTIKDIERTFMVLAGRDPDPTDPEKQYVRLVDAIDAGRQGWGRRQGESESEFFTARSFKKGTLHVWFKDKDLVKQVNKLLAEYYGAGIPKERDDGDRERPGDAFKARGLAVAKNMGWFPTPEAVAERVVGMSALTRREGPPLEVLEPSAGEGALASRCAASGASVDCVELHPSRAATLRDAGRYRRVIHDDFMDVKPDPARLYDRVVMNPPFSGDLASEHVHHALSFLKDDGLLVAILPAGVEFRQTAKAKALRAIVEALNGGWYDLPPDSFKECGTSCNTVVLKLWKNGRRADMW